MNMKATIAVVMAFVMAATAVVVAVQDNGSDGATTPVPVGMTLNPDDTGVGQTTLLYFTETAYGNGTTYQSYSLKWEAKIVDNAWTTSDDSWTPITTDGIGADAGRATVQADSAGKNALSVSLSKSATNEYLLNVRAVQDASYDSTVYLSLKCTVTVTLAGTSNVTMTLDPQFYNVTVTMGDAKGVLTIYEGNTQISNTSPFTFTQYTSYPKKNFTAKIGEESITPNQYRWYATNMPAGLSMDPEGFITGYPISTTNSAQGVQVVATDKNGTMFQTTIYIQVNAASTHSGTVNIEVENDDGHIKNPVDRTYYVESGDAFTFKPTLTYGGQDVTNNTTFYVSSVTLDQGQTTAGTTTVAGGASFTADTSGSGAYIITVSAVYGHLQFQESYYLYVLESAEGGATASIGIMSE